MSPRQDPTAEPLRITNLSLSTALIGRRIVDVVEDDLGEQFVLFEDGARLKVFGEEGGDVLGRLILPRNAKEPPPKQSRGRL